MTLGEAAAAFAFRGWPVFPCRPRDKRPLTDSGFKDASTDAETVARWWRRWPDASIGYPTGALLVVDLDGPTGLASCEALRAEHDWPVTLTALTGRGAHFYFRPPAGVRVPNAAGVRGQRGLGEGIDVRGHGGYVILPPSTHPSGRRYAWTVRRDPAPLPAWMLKRLEPPAPLRRTAADERRERYSASRYADAAISGEVAAVHEAPEGQLNDTLNRAAFKLGLLIATEGGVSEATVADALLAAALACGHPERGARSTIRSGLSSGLAKVRR